MLTEQETSSLCFDLRETHIDRAKLDRAESLRRREKQNQASLVYYSIVSSPLIKRESKHFHFIKSRRNLAEFYKFSFARSSVSSRNSWPCCCNRLKKNGRRQLESRFIVCPHTLSTKKIQEPAASKITQQKGSVNYREHSIKDSVTHCGLAVVNSLPYYGR